LSSTWDRPQVASRAAVEETVPSEALLNSGLMATAHEHVVEAIEEAPAEQAKAVPAEQTPAATESFYSPEPELREEVPEAAEPPAPRVSEPEPAAVPASVASPLTGAPSPAEAHLDELVAKVLAKMNPDVLQAVTREIIKPVVEA